MEKKEFIAQSLGKVQQGFSDTITSALSDAVDFGVSSVVIPEPAPVLGADADEQAKIDAAVAQAVGPLNDKIASMQASLDDEKMQLDKALSDDESDKAAIESGKSALAAKQGVLDQIAALLK